MLTRRVQSLFKSDKRELALERLATGVVGASENCSIALNNIATICHHPKNHSNQHKLINQWAQDLFFYNIPLLENRTELIITLSTEETAQLSDIFFNYIISLLPFLYEKQNINAERALLNRGKYKWTSDDYKNLREKVIHKRFDSQWNSLSIETKLSNPTKRNEVQLKVDESYHTMDVSSEAASSFRNKRQKIDDIVSTEHLKLKMARIKPNFKHQYQMDLYKFYTEEFADLVSNSLKLFDNNFYEVGTYLHKYFQWSGD